MRTIKKLKVYSTFQFEPALFKRQNLHYHVDLHYCFEPLSDANLPEHNETSAICLFVSDHVDAKRLKQLKSRGVEAIFLRSKGFDHVDLNAAKELNVAVIPTDYDTCSVVEHTIGLLLALARKFRRSFLQVHEGNFALENLLGMELHDRVAGVVGTGKIGHNVAKILLALGMHVLAYDVHPDPALINQNVHYVSLETLLRLSDIVTLHSPLMPETHHLINADRLALMQRHAFLVNTARGGLVDTVAVLNALAANQLGGFALDVYEFEAPFFFEKLDRPLKDPILEKLLNEPKVVLTAHQGFLSDISVETLIGNCLKNFEHWIQETSNH